MGFFDSFKNIFGTKEKEYLSGFQKTNHQLGYKLRLINANGNIDSGTFMEDLMVTLLDADIGYYTAEKICNIFIAKAKKKKLNNDEFMELLQESMREIYLAENDSEINMHDGLNIILLVGVNGSGKTTSCAKLANFYQKQGKKVCMAAADTFRAGAVEQLASWGNKLNIKTICGNPNEDPSSVIVKACRFAKENNYDLLICDTAGRLQNKKNLMAELNKMHKVIIKECGNVDENTWLVIDANTGQNALSQAKLFNEATDLNGIILTKMDGTAKGGIVLAIKDQLSLPVRFVGFGEKEDDLKAFDLDLYLYSILGDFKDEH